MKPSAKSLRPRLLCTFVAGFCLSFGLASVRHICAGRAAEVVVCEGAGTRFNVAPQLAAGRFPRVAVAADFNNDNLPDLAVINLTPSSEQQLLIMLGNGRGEFAVVNTLRTGGSGSISYTITNALAAGDLNGDNKQDLVVAAGGDGVRVLLGSGDGRFAAPVVLAAGSESTSVIVADFNGDNRRDIAAAFRNGQVRVLPGNGDGTFGQATMINAGTSTTAMSSADLNNDGRLDLVVLAGVNSAPYLNQGNGAFTKGATFDPSSVQAVALGDFNGDGKQDLVVSDFSSASLRLGDGLGGFGMPMNIGAGGSASVADLNKDNRADLILAGSSVSVLLGNATGLAARTDYAAGRNPVSSAVADFNRDGLLDVAIVNQGGTGFSSADRPGTISVLLGASAGRFQASSPLVLRAPANSLKVADLNNDGRADLLATAGSSGATNVVLSNNEGGFAAPQLYGFTSGGRDYRAAVVADFNNDALPDLATLGYSGFGQASGVASVFPGTAAGVFNNNRGRDFNIGDNPDGLVAADFNRDGFFDLATANLNSHDVSILFNDRRGGFGMETRFAVGLEPRSLTTADFNSDGNADLVVANRNSATISLLLGDGRGLFNHILIGVGANPRALVVADANGDNKLDLVVVFNNVARAAVLLNTGAGGFGAPITSELSRIAFDLVVADFTGDGKLDLAASGLATAEIQNERVALIAGDGAGRFVAAGEFALPIAGLLGASDFNADGLADLFVVGGNNVWLVANGCNTTPRPALANVSAASFQGLLLAPEMIVAAFGNGFTAQTVSATTLPLPAELGGVSIKVKDQAGVERAAPLFFVAPGQVNYLLPAGTMSGSAAVTVTGADNRTYSETVLITPTAPSLFAANADGQGAAAAAILRIRFPGGAMSFEPVVEFDAAQGRFVPLPIDFGPGLEPAADQLFLVLFGTGIRARSALAAVTATVGPEAAAVLFAEAQGDLIGLDQVNLRLSRNLRGSGEVEVVLTVDGKTANVVRVAFR